MSTSKNNVYADPLAQSVYDTLNSIGFDVTDDNFVKTPTRVASMYREILDGEFDLEKKMNSLFMATFPSDYRGLVKLHGIEAWGLCPHHLLPISYNVNVGYVPSEKMIGLSKLPRLVKLLSARAVMQETFTHDIVYYMNKYLDCQGSIAVVQGQHYCMMVRGVKDNATTTTSEIRGIFETDKDLKWEFFNV